MWCLRRLACTQTLLILSWSQDEAGRPGSEGPPNIAWSGSGQQLINDTLSDGHSADERGPNEQCGQLQAVLAWCPACLSSLHVYPLK